MEVKVALDTPGEARWEDNVDASTVFLDTTEIQGFTASGKVKCEDEIEALSAVFIGIRKEVGSREVVTCNDALLLFRPSYCGFSISCNDALLFSITMDSYFASCSKETSVA
jgi:hypothetical protein